MKPDGPSDYKGEFNPISTNTPGIQICEHLPLLAQRSHLRALVRSLLMARRLVELGVNMVQVNLGNFGSWDLHGNNIPLLRNYLFPPTDQAVSIAGLMS